MIILKLSSLSIHKLKKPTAESIYEITFGSMAIFSCDYTTELSGDSPFHVIKSKVLYFAPPGHPRFALII